MSTCWELGMVPELTLSDSLSVIVNPLRRKALGIKNGSRENRTLTRSLDKASWWPTRGQLWLERGGGFKRGARISSATRRKGSRRC